MMLHDFCDASIVFRRAARIAQQPSRHRAIVIGIEIRRIEANRLGKVRQRPLRLAKAQVDISTRIIGTGPLGIDLDGARQILKRLL